MEVFLQQLINGLTLGSIYGLIAIGYTMVFGIIGMVNFAHGDVFMVGAFIALIFFLILDGLARRRRRSRWRCSSCWSSAMVAHRPVELDDRARRLPAAARLVPPRAADLRHRHVDLPAELRAGRAGPAQQAAAADDPGQLHADGRAARPPSSLAYKQILIMVVTAVLLALFWYLVQKTPLGRAQRACEQDRKMAALLGIDVDRTISLTFVIGAALAAVAGVHVPDVLRRRELLRRLRAGREGLHRRRARRHRLAARRGARRAADRPDRGLVVGLFLHRLQGCRGLLDPRHRADLHAVRHPRPARSREGLSR